MKNPLESTLGTCWSSTQPKQKPGTGRRQTWCSRTRWQGAGLAGLLALSGLSVQAQTYLVDFGGANTTKQGATPDDPSHVWNNITGTEGSSATGALSNLISSLNVTSSINIVIVKPFNGVNENGTQNSTIYPINATRDSLYGNTESFNGLTNIFPSFKLTGLDSAATYSFTFYASREGVGDNRETEYTVTGSNSGVTTLNPANNIDEFATVNGITPGAGNEITISIAPSANNNNANHFTYLGVLKVDAVPPQTPLAFTKQPISQRVVQLKPVTFSTAVSGPPPHFVQWYQDGVAIPDATAFDYTIPSVELSMNGWKFSVSVSNLVYGVLSSNAVLTVLSDTNRPVLLSAASYDGLTITLGFNEPLDPTAYTPSFYRVNNGAIGVSSTALSINGQTVTLTLDAPVSGTFTVVVNNVQDLAGNAVTPNSSVSGKLVALEDQDLLFDLGGANTTVLGPAPDDPVNYWNNITASIGGSDTGLLENLVTIYNAQTPYTFAVISRFNGANENGTLVSAVFPAKATRDSLYGNTEVFGGLSNVFPSFKLTGLNPARQYSFTFYASRTGVGDVRETRYTVAGATTNSATLNAANNINNTTQVQGIAPTAAGDIVVSLSPTANNNNANHFTYLGVMRVAPYKAPLMFLPAVLEGGQIKLRWTGSGQLLQAPSLSGPWTAVLPAPSSPYSVAIVSGENRFYRLQQ